jgi:hypothetical protein
MLTPMQQETPFEWAISGNAPYVDISGATQSAPYVTPHDGWAMYIANQNYNTDHISQLVISPNLSSRSNSGDIIPIFLKKGMTIYFAAGTNLYAPYAARFYPIVD